MLEKQKKKFTLNKKQLLPPPCIVPWPRIAEQTNKQRADDASPLTALKYLRVNIEQASKAGGCGQMNKRYRGYHDFRG